MFRSSVTLDMLLICFILVAITSCSDPPEKIMLPKFPVAEADDVGWTKVEPGDETRCARDTEYAYWYREGTTNNVFIYFQGGGGCFDAASCGTVGSYDDAITASDDPNAMIGGVFDLDHPDNPFRDYSMLFVPYCTGDVHSGNLIETYTAVSGNSFTIHHRGNVNANAALEWVDDNFELPEKIFVSGCSAGSIGSILHAPHIIEEYQDSVVTQLGDSGGGLTSFIEWNIGGDYDAGAYLPDWIPGMQDEIAQSFTVSKFTTAVATHYPNYTFAQYNAFDDRTQRRYFMADGGADDAFPDALQSSLNEIHDSSPNFHSYTGAGDRHCILKHPAFYEEEANGVRLLDWVTKLVNQEEVETVKCEEC